MDPNNNQPINTNPLGQQPVMPQPVVAPAPTVSAPPPTPPEQPEPAQPVVNQNAPMMPKGNKKTLILLMLLVLLMLVMGAYVIFTKNEVSNSQKAATQNKSVAIPTTTAPTITPATVDEINIASPDADLNGIENDLLGL